MKDVYEENIGRDVPGVHLRLCAMKHRQEQRAVHCDKRLVLARTVGPEPARHEVLRVVERVPMSAEPSGCPFAPLSRLQLAGPGKSAYARPVTRSGETTPVSSMSTTSKGCVPIRRPRGTRGIEAVGTCLEELTSYVLYMREAWKRFWYSVERSSYCSCKRCKSAIRCAS